MRTLILWVGLFGFAGAVVGCGPEEPKPAADPIKTDPAKSVPISGPDAGGVPVKKR